MTEDPVPGTMADVDHTNPYTGETFGGVYRRGPAVADGGETTHAIESTAPPADADADTDESEATSTDADTTDVTEQTMADVEHASENEDVTDVWSRGHRGHGGRED